MIRENLMLQELFLMVLNHRLGNIKQVLINQYSKPKVIFLVNYIAEMTKRLLQQLTTLMVYQILVRWFVILMELLLHLKMEHLNHLTLHNQVKQYHTMTLLEVRLSYY